MLVSLQAQEIYTTGNIPKVHLQDKTRYVCNLSYLQTDWYTDQMRRPAYNSASLPIALNFMHKLISVLNS
jgi:hypothetical protein